MQTAAIHTHETTDGFTQLSNEMQRRFLANTRNGAIPVFKTDAAHLWEKYLDSFEDLDERQYHNCDCCKQFIRNFGGLACISPEGRVTSALWHGVEATNQYQAAVKALDKAVGASRIRGVFLSSDVLLGTRFKGGWEHFTVTAATWYKKTHLTAGQAMAEKKEDFKNVVRALAEFKPEHLQAAVTLLKTDSLYRSEKVLSQAQWLRDLQVSVTNNRNKNTLVWKAVASAPAGFCHPRGGMLGTLIDDIAAGKSSRDIFANFDVKMAPDRYQRPQAAPTAGAIEAAEKLFKKLGLEKSVERRFCRLDELQTFWTPKASTEETGSLFGHLVPKGGATDPIVTPVQEMSWEKFKNTLLPDAERIECSAPMRGNYSAFVTAVHPDAPPILQWDSEEDRNPVSTYVWKDGSSSSSFGLVSSDWYPVSALVYQPSMWSGKPTPQAPGVVFVIEGAHETRADTGAALFPEILRAELHGVRSVIEAYSKSAKLEGLKEPHAAGIAVAKSMLGYSPTFRVWLGKVCVSVKLTSWD